MLKNNVTKYLSVTLAKKDVWIAAFAVSSFRIYVYAVGAQLRQSKMFVFVWKLAVMSISAAAKLFGVVKGK